MKLTAHFDKFLADEVNLNPHRIETLTDRVETIQKFLQGSDLKLRIRRFSAQGSWSHGTIIKPPGNGGFDADLLVFVEPVLGWSAKQYVLELRRVFSASAVYADKTTLGNRCVTLEYAKDFSLDVVPCVAGRLGGVYHFEVCAREADQFEPTDSEAYSRWVEQQAGHVGGHHLRHAIRLLKYLRDIKQTFSCKSVLLTTLVAGRITAADRQRPYLFADTPTTLRTLVQRLDDYLQARPLLHPVQNPILPMEHFTRQWDEDKYANFRNMIHKYREWIDDAFQEGNETDSIEKWQDVFGDEFGAGRRALTERIKAELLPVQLAGRFRDAVDAVSSLGLMVLQHVKPQMPWMKPMPWQNAGNKIKPNIKATLHNEREGQSVRTLASGEIIPKFKHIKFEATSSNGISFRGNKDFNIQWQVVNTDTEASQAEGGLRGGFYPSKKRGVRWESTLYRGVHWVQAFVIRKRDKSCLGQSDRFFVVIE